jgi:3-hydroxyisobutyrate dehydrogenase-like beta-hydroxyacid dehydrogenase
LALTPIVIAGASVSFRATRAHGIDPERTLTAAEKLTFNATVHRPADAGEANCSGPGATACCAELQPMLAVFGKVFFIGERPGMGQTMKLANNLLSATAMAATAEAVVYGVKSGLDPAVMCDVINAGSGRNTASMDKVPRQVITRKFAQGFATGLMYKDVRLCLEEAESLGVPMPVAAGVRALWARASEELGADSDMTAIVQLIERAAGVEVKGK